MKNKLKIEEVVAGYNFILNRNPETGLDLENIAQTFESISSYRENLMNSDEGAGLLYEQLVSKLPIWVKVPTIFGQRIYVCLSDVGVSKGIFLTSNWEPEVGKSILSLINQDSYFLDIGANIGWFSLLVGDFIQKRNGSGRVISVEANPTILQYLMASVVDSGLSNLISIKPYAISNKYEIIQMESGVNGNVGGLKIGQLSENSSIERNIIPTVILDDILKDLPRLDMIKMDIEGAEPLALEGMSKMLYKFSPKIIMEINADGLKTVSGKSVTQLVKQMKSYGYTPYDIIKNGIDSVEISEVEICDIVAARGHYDFLFQKS